MSFWLYLGFGRRDFIENFNLHTCAAIDVKFGCDQSVIKGTLLVAQRTIFGSISVSTGDILLDLIPRTLHACAIKGVSLVAIGE